MSYQSHPVTVRRPDWVSDGARARRPETQCLTGHPRRRHPQRRPHGALTRTRRRRHNRGGLTFQRIGLDDLLSVSSPT